MIRILGFVFILVSFCQGFSEARAAAPFSDEEWRKFEEIVADYYSDHSNEGSLNYLDHIYSDKAVRELLRALNITLSFSEIQDVYQRFKVIQLRPLRSDRLLAGCGNLPLVGDGIANRAGLRNSEESRLNHQHSAFDTVDPGILMNPTFVGYLGSPEVRDFLSFRNKRYDLIRPEGFGLCSVREMSGAESRERLARMGESVSAGGHLEGLEFTISLFKLRDLAANGSPLEAVVLSETEFEHLRSFLDVAYKQRLAGEMDDFELDGRVANFPVVVSAVERIKSDVHALVPFCSNIRRGAVKYHGLDPESLERAVQLDTDTGLPQSIDLNDFNCLNVYFQGPEFYF